MLDKFLAATLCLVVVMWSLDALVRLLKHQYPAPLTIFLAISLVCCVAFICASIIRDRWPA